MIANEGEFTVESLNVSTAKGTKKKPVMKCPNGTCSFERDIDDDDNATEPGEETVDLASNG